jgi:hypothetical protein
MGIRGIPSLPNCPFIRGIGRERYKGRKGVNTVVGRRFGRQENVSMRQSEECC